MSLAERRLDDLTTAGIGVHPDAVAVAPAHWPSPPRPVPGRELSGEQPGLGRFVLRIPDDWNGRLVVAGTPGNRTERAGDVIFSDFVLPRGYAYLAGDKAGTGGGLVAGASVVPVDPDHPFGLDFPLLRPEVTLAGWTTSLAALTDLARDRLAALQRRAPERTYLLGISNGGYQVRRLLETSPADFDGGVDWEGVHWAADGPNLFIYLPTAIREYRRFADRSLPPDERERARLAILAAGFPPNSDPLWEMHDRVYWSLTQWLYARKLDPDYDGQPADYDYFARPPSVRERIREIETTGAIGKPLLTLHGTLDCLLPPALHALAYAEAVRRQGRRDLHRLYLVERGNHIENFAELIPAARLELMLPHVHRAFDLLVEWVEQGREPPPSQTIQIGGQIAG